jgi:hypothetical protein
MMSDWTEWDYSLQFEQKQDTSVAGRLLRGAIDLHLHFDPEPWMTRRFDALETALHARENGLGGLVLKNRAYCTEPLAQLVRRLVPDVHVFGSITLDGEVGGLNYRAVKGAAAMGTKVLWLPVFYASNSKPVVERNFGLDLGSEAITILDGSGRLLPVVRDILAVALEHNMVVNTGHVSPREVFAVAEECSRLGLKKLIVTHPMSTIVFEEALTLDQTVSLAKDGVYIEYCGQFVSPTGDCLSPSAIADNMRAVGPEHAVITTDFGGTPHPTIAEGLRMFISSLIKKGVAEDDIATMVKRNPRRLLDLPQEE